MLRDIVIKAADIRAAVDGAGNLAKQYRSVLALVDTLGQVANLEQYIDDTNLAASVARRQLEKAQQDLAAVSRAGENQVQRWATAEADALDKLEAAKAELAAFDADAKARTDAAAAELQRVETALAAARAEAAALAAKLGA